MSRAKPTIPKKPSYLRGTQRPVAARKFLIPSPHPRQFSPFSTAQEYPCSTALAPCVSNEWTSFSDDESRISGDIAKNVEKVDQVSIDIKSVLESDGGE